MTDSNFTIGFIGLGLIGGSIAKGIRRVFPNYTLIGMDENPDTIKSVLEDGIIDSIARLQNRFCGMQLCISVCTGSI